MCKPNCKKLIVQSAQLQLLSYPTRRPKVIGLGLRRDPSTITDCNDNAPYTDSRVARMFYKVEREHPSWSIIPIDSWYSNGVWIFHHPCRECRNRRSEARLCRRLFVHHHARSQGILDGISRETFSVRGNYHYCKRGVCGFAV